MQHHDAPRLWSVTFVSFLHSEAFILVDVCLEVLIYISRILITMPNVIDIMLQPCSYSIRASYDAMVRKVIEVVIVAGAFDVEGFLAFLCFLSLNRIFFEY